MTSGALSVSIFNHAASILLPNLCANSPHFDVNNAQQLYEKYVVPRVQKESAKCPYLL